MLFVLSIPLPLYPSIHLSIYLSIVLQGGEEEEFSRQRLENNNNNNNSSKKELDNDIPSLLARFESTRKTSCGPVSSFGRVTPSPSRVRSGQWSSFHPSRPSLVSSTLACRTRVARLVGNASSRRKVARGGGGGGEKRDEREKRVQREGRCITG